MPRPLVARRAPAGERKPKEPKEKKDKPEQHKEEGRPPTSSPCPLTPTRPAGTAHARSHTHMHARLHSPFSRLGEPFAKIDIRVGYVTKVERHPNADRSAASRFVFH